MMLKLSHRRESDVLTIDLNGDLTMETADRLLDGLARVPASVGRVRLNCAELRCIDSTGVGVMIQYVLDGRQRGITLELDDVPPEVHDVMEVLGFLEFLEGDAE